jgi:Zn-dependent metalloprotease
MSRSSSGRHPRRVPNLTLALAALVACGGSDDSGKVVTEPVNHQETALAPAGPDLEVAAADYVRTYNDALDLGLSSQDEYDVFNVTEADGLRHARMQQIYSGVPVFGADVVVHADDTTFLGFNGYVTKNLDGFDIAPTIAEDAAMNAAKDDLSGGVSLTYSNEESKLVILPGEREGANLAWYVKFRNEGSGDIEPGIWNYFIDAKTGAVLKKFDTLYTLEQGSGPGGSPKKARAWAAELDVEPMGAEFLMDTDKLQTLDRSNADMVIRSMELANFVDTEGNNAHGFAEITLNMMRDWMGRESLDDAGFKIISRVHDTDYCPGAPRNACWDGTQMTYGDGGDPFYPFAGSLDVVAHELNHGFTQFHSNLTYANQSGGLNESFSDISGACAEAYAEGSASDFLVGEDVWIADGALRYMCDPTMDGSSIGDAGDYYDGIDPHYSSGVPNRAFCLAVGRFQVIWGGTDPVTATSEVGHIWYTANGSYWTAGTTYEQACRGTIDAARALGWDGEATQALADSWADVGVVCESDVYVCNEDGTCDAAGGETCASCNEDCGPCEGQGPCSFFKRAKCALGIGDCSDCEGEPGCGDGICTGDETDATCGQDCGCAALNCESVAPFGCWCDFECEDYGDCCADYAMCE